MRTLLSVQVSEQTGWKSASQAFDAWRSAVERLGITVVLFSMTPESSRGFSIWDDVAPLVAVNTAWRDEARVFTLFHEVGHLLTRTDSACANAPLATGDNLDAAERWCEAFAAEVLIPESAIARVSGVSDIKELARLARQYQVSLRAMAISLINAGKATWTLYRSIPGTADAKTGGGGGTGRNRREIREDEFGHRGTEMFVEAVQREVITKSQALDYLDIPVAEFDRLPLAVPTEA
jgi:Zn-dependent peptidase ImmA (M78 family)